MHTKMSGIVISLSMLVHFTSYHWSHWSQHTHKLLSAQYRTPHLGQIASSYSDAFSSSSANTLSRFFPLGTSAFLILFLLLLLFSPFYLSSPFPSFSPQFPVPCSLFFNSLLLFLFLLDLSLLQFISSKHVHSFLVFSS